VLFIKYNKNYQAEEDEVGGACDAIRGEEESVWVVGRKEVTGRN
jgi:hypothetical protein